jgi:hypothetical protein
MENLRLSMRLIHVSSGSVALHSIVVGLMVTPPVVAWVAARAVSEAPTVAVAPDRSAIRASSIDDPSIRPPSPASAHPTSAQRQQVPAHGACRDTSRSCNSILPATSRHSATLRCGQSLDRGAPDTPRRMVSRIIGSSAKIVLKREAHLPRSHCDAIELRPSTEVAEEPIIREATTLPK